MSLILDLIGPERPELFALELRKLLYFTLFTPIFNQSALNLAKICMTIRSWTSLIMGQSEMRTTGVIYP